MGQIKIYVQELELIILIWTIAKLKFNQTDYVINDKCRQNKKNKLIKTLKQ